MAGSPFQAVLTGLLFICCSVGYMLGLGLAVSALCNDSQTEARAHVLSVIDKLQSLLESQSLEHQVRIV